MYIIVQNILKLFLDYSLVLIHPDTSSYQQEHNLRSMIQFIFCSYCTLLLSQIFSVVQRSKSLRKNFDKMNHFNIDSVKLTLNIASQSS